ncbi:MAG: TolC family protein [Tissierellia bacterium]|nr:TolC family protein [Tissierellia bacterium]
MKRKISLLMVIMLILSTFTTFAGVEETALSVETEETGPVEARTVDMEESEVLELSMDDAIKLATDSSREMWKIDDWIRQLQDAKSAGNSAKELYELITTMPLEQGASNLNYLELILAKNDFYSKTADLRTIELNKSRETLLLNIEKGVRELYYGVVLLEKTVGINQIKLDSANEQLRVVNLKFNNGSATKAEVLNAEMAVQKAKTDLDSAVDDLNLFKLNFLNLLNLPLDSKIVLTDTELTYIPTKEVNLDEAIKKAFEERIEILTAENDLELQKIETHAYKAYYTSNLRQYKFVIEKLKDAELSVPQAYKDVELDIRSKHLNLVKAERALINADKTLEIAKEASRINKLLFDNGMATTLDVLNANEGLAGAEIQRYSSLVDYTLKKFVFDNSNILGSMPQTTESSKEEASE